MPLSVQDYEVSFKNTFLNFHESPRPDLRRTQTSRASFASLTPSECDLCTPLPSPRPLSPKDTKKVLDDYVASVAEGSLQTTVMIRGIPKSYTQDLLLAEVMGEGLPVDFLYLPPGKSKSNRSYGFVNFETEEAAKVFLWCFQGHRWVLERSHKPATVGLATLQGYLQNVEFYSMQQVAKGIATRSPWVKN